MTVVFLKCWYETVMLDLQILNDHTVEMLVFSVSKVL